MAWKPRNYRKNLELLKERSHELNCKIEDGSFYELSYFARYREVRKIKQLYNRLMGPISEGALRQAVSFASVLVLVAGAGCDSSSDETMAQVTLKLITDSTPAASAYSKAAAVKAAAPDGVTDITLTISGKHMSTITKSIPLSTSAVSLLVPGGNDRLFQVRADMTNEDYYTGSATADLKAGRLNEVSIPMTFVDAPEPDIMAPVPGGEMSTNSITFNSLDLTWPAATDNITPQADLQYAIYRNGTLYQNFTTHTGDPITVTITGLSPATEYSFIVYVRDEAGNTAAYAAASATTPVMTTSFVQHDDATNPFYGVNLDTFSHVYPSFGDIDNDGNLDLMLSGAVGGGDLKVYHNNNNSTFTEITPLPADLDETGNYGFRVLADIDGNGAMDVLATDEANNTVVFYNTGDPGTFSSFNTPTTLITSTITETTYNAIITLGNIDGDSDLDVLVGRTGSYDEGDDFRYFQNTGNEFSPSFSSVEINPYGLSYVGFSYTFSPSLVDIDNDGDLDLFAGIANVGASSDAELLFYENNAGTFGGVQVNPFSFLLATPDIYRALHPAFVDLDNDGDLDMFIGTRNSSILYFENRVIP